MAFQRARGELGAVLETYDERNIPDFSAEATRCVTDFVNAFIEILAKEAPEPRQSNLQGMPEPSAAFVQGYTNNV